MKMQAHLNVYNQMISHNTCPSKLRNLYTQQYSILFQVISKKKYLITFHLQKSKKNASQFVITKKEVTFRGFVASTSLQSSTVALYKVGKKQQQRESYHLGKEKMMGENRKSERDDKKADH
jgi:hypothetical protein